MKIVRESVTMPSLVLEAEMSFTGNQLREKLRGWFSPPDPSVNFNTARGLHHKGSAAWFIQGSTFADWKESGSLMWIYGKRTFSSFTFSAFSVC
jgi:hypothetical protein